MPDTQHRGHDTAAQKPEQDDFDAILPDRLKILRQSLGISAAKLDQFADFSPGTAGRLERGDQRIYATHLYKIAAATGISISYFFASAEARTDPASAQSASADELDKQRLLNAYLQIRDPRLKREVFELVETLAQEYPNPGNP